MGKKVYSSVHTEVAFVAISFAVWASKHQRAARCISNAICCSHPSTVAKETVTSASNMLYHINAATMI